MTKGDYEVGYGRPPKAHQFKKGQSGCPTGRPKSSGAVRLNLDEMLEANVNFNDAAGRQRRAPRAELLFRKQVERALSGDLRSLNAVMKQFIACDAVQLGQVIQDCSTVRVPRDIPMDLGRITFRMYGRPPWSDKKIIQACVRWEQKDPDAAKAFMANRFGIGRK